MQLVTIYRPPPSKENKFKVSTFLQEFQALLAEMAPKPGSLLIVGDHTFHLEEPHRPEVRDFMHLLNSADLEQHVLDKTHISGRTLDLLITRSEDDFLTNVNVDLVGLSHVERDHYPVSCSLHFQSKFRPNMWYASVGLFTKLTAQPLLEIL